MPFVWINEGVRLPIESAPQPRAPRILPLRNDDTEKEKPTLPLPGRLAQQTYDQVANPHESRRQVILARQIMSAPVTTLPPTTTIFEAWAIIREHRFRHIPIVDDHGIPMGIISDRDLLQEVLVKDGKLIHRADVEETTESIGHLVSSPVLTALPHAEIHQIARTLIEQRIGALPIIDDSNRLIGIITRSDVLRTLVTHGPLELWV